MGGSRSFTQLAMVKLPMALKSTAGVVACAPEPFRYKDLTPSSSTYLAPSTRLFKQQRTSLTLQEFCGLWNNQPASFRGCLYMLCIAVKGMNKSKWRSRPKSAVVHKQGLFIFQQFKAFNCNYSLQLQLFVFSYQYKTTGNINYYHCIIMTYDKFTLSAHLTSESVPSRAQWLTMSAARLFPFLIYFFKK